MLLKSATGEIKSTPPPIQDRVKTFDIIFLSFKLNSFTIEIFEDYNMLVLLNLFYIDR